MTPELAAIENAVTEIQSYVPDNDHHLVIKFPTPAVENTVEITKDKVVLTEVKPSLTKTTLELSLDDFELTANGGPTESYTYADFGNRLLNVTSGLESGQATMNLKPIDETDVGAPEAISQGQPIFNHEIKLLTEEELATICGGVVSANMPFLHITSMQAQSVKGNERSPIGTKKSPFIRSFKTFGRFLTSRNFRHMTHALAGRKSVGGVKIKQEFDLKTVMKNWSQLTQAGKDTIVQSVKSSPKVAASALLNVFGFNSEKALSGADLDAFKLGFKVLSDAPELVTAMASELISGVNRIVKLRLANLDNVPTDKQQLEATEPLFRLAYLLSDSFPGEATNAVEILESWVGTQNTKLIENLKALKRHVTDKRASLGSKKFSSDQLQKFSVRVNPIGINKAFQNAKKETKESLESAYVTSQMKSSLGDIEDLAETGYTEAALDFFNGVFNTAQSLKITDLDDQFTSIFNQIVGPLLPKGNKLHTGENLESSQLKDNAKLYLRAARILSEKGDFNAAFQVFNFSTYFIGKHDLGDQKTFASIVKTAGRIITHFPEKERADRVGDLLKNVEPFTRLNNKRIGQFIDLQVLAAKVLKDQAKKDSRRLNSVIGRLKIAYEFAEKIHDTPRQLFILKKLGASHLDKKNYKEAATVFNAGYRLAVDTQSDSETIESFKKAMEVPEKRLLENNGVNPKNSQANKWESHREYLGNIRALTDFMLRKLDPSLPTDGKPYSFSEKDNAFFNKALIDVLGEFDVSVNHKDISLNNILEFLAVKLDSLEVEDVQAITSKLYIKLVNSMVQDAIQSLGKEPPCEFALMAHGSLARGEISAFSDLECGFVIADQQHKNYFLQLAQLLTIKVTNLGETTCKLANESINETGFCIDTGNIVPTELIYTPELYAQLQETGGTTFDPFIDSQRTAQRTGAFMMGSSNMVNKFYGAIDKVMDDTKIGQVAQYPLRKVCWEALIIDVYSNEDFKTPDLQTAEKISIKPHLLRVPSLLVKALALKNRIHSANTIVTIRKLMELGELTQQQGDQLIAGLRVAFKWRMSVHLYHGEEHEGLLVNGSGKGPKISQSDLEKLKAVEEFADVLARQLKINDKKVNRENAKSVKKDYEEVLNQVK